MTRKTKPSAKTLTALSALAFACSTLPAHAQGFTSPSGNIVCYVDLYGGLPAEDSHLVCAIFSADWAPPPPPDDGNDRSCELDQTNIVYLPAQGQGQSISMCHGDVFWPVPLGELNYGSDWSMFDYMCEMATDGVRCVNASGNSIAVNRARWLAN